MLKLARSQQSMNIDAKSQHFLNLSLLQKVQRNEQQVVRNNLLKVGREIFNMEVPPKENSRPETDLRLIKEVFSKPFSSLDKPHFASLFWVLAESLFKGVKNPKDLIVAALKNMQLESFSSDTILFKKGATVNKYYVIIGGNASFRKSKKTTDLAFKDTFAEECVAKDLINNAYVSSGQLKTENALVVLSIGIMQFNQISEENMMALVQERIQYLQKLHLCQGLKKSLVTTLSFYLTFQSYENKQFVYKQHDPLDDNIYLVFSGHFALSVETPLENEEQLASERDMKALYADFTTNRSTTHQQIVLKRKELRVFSKYGILGLGEVVAKYMNQKEDQPEDIFRSHSVQCVEAGKMLVINEDLFFMHYFNINSTCEHRVMQYLAKEEQENERAGQKYKEVLKEYNELLTYNKKRTERNKPRADTPPSAEKMQLPFIEEFQNTKDSQKGLSERERVQLSSLKSVHLQNNPDLGIIRQARRLQNLPRIDPGATKNQRKAIMVDFFQKGFVQHNIQHDSLYVLSQQNIKMKNLEHQMFKEMMSNYSPEKRGQVKREMRQKGQSMSVHSPPEVPLTKKGSFYTQLPTEMRTKKSTLATQSSQAEVLKKRLTHLQRTKAQLRSKTIKEFFHYFDTSDIHL